MVRILFGNLRVKRTSCRYNIFRLPVLRKVTNGNANTLPRERKGSDAEENSLGKKIR
jgi:hypothetical protein